MSAQQVVKKALVGHAEIFILDVPWKYFLSNNMQFDSVNLTL